MFIDYKVNFHKKIISSASFAILDGIEEGGLVLNFDEMWSVQRGKDIIVIHSMRIKQKPAKKTLAFGNVSLF